MYANSRSTVTLSALPADSLVSRRKHGEQLRIDVWCPLGVAVERDDVLAAVRAARSSACRELRSSAWLPVRSKACCRHRREKNLRVGQ